MERIKTILKNKENLFILVLIVLSLTGITLSVSLSISDEVWNFQNIYKMFNEYQIYEDANVICTPLVFYLGNFIFNIFGANFLVFRIYSIIIFSFYFFMTYKILRILGINIKISTICILVLLMFDSFVTPRVMANYNSLAVAIALLGIYMLLKKKTVIDNKMIIIQSIICFLVILTKQNIGLFYFIALNIFILISKQERKLIKILEEIGILIVLSIFFVIFLSVNEILEGFINYTILGMGQFANDNLTINWNYIIGIISIFIINIVSSIFLTINTKNLVTKEEKENLKVLNCFSIFMLLIIIPIINETHFLFAIHISLILLAYIFNIIIKKGNIKLNKHRNVVTIILLILVTIDIGANVYCLIEWGRNIFGTEYYYEYKDPYFGSIVDKETNTNIKNVTNFIKEKQENGNDVVVFSAKAALYMIPLKESNGYLDLPFSGNFGNLSENDVINDLKERNNMLVLLEKEDEKEEKWQENENIISRIREEFQYIGTIEEFEIYKF